MTIVLLALMRFCYKRFDGSSQGGVSRFSDIIVPGCWVRRRPHRDNDACMGRLFAGSLSG